MKVTLHTDFDETCSCFDMYLYHALLARLVCLVLTCCFDLGAEAPDPSLEQAQNQTVTTQRSSQRLRWHLHPGIPGPPRPLLFVRTSAGGCNTVTWLKAETMQRIVGGQFW